MLFGWQDFGVARFVSRAKLKIRHSKPGLACKHPDDMFTLCRIALAQATRIIELLFIHKNGDFGELL